MTVARQAPIPAALFRRRGLNVQGYPRCALCGNVNRTEDDYCSPLCKNRAKRKEWKP